MNGYLVISIGLVLVGVGGFLGFYGAQLNNRADNATTSDTFNTQIGKVLGAIASAKEAVGREVPSGSGAGLSTTPEPATSAARREAQQKLVDIEQDFSQWASDFIGNRDLKRLELEREALETRTKEIQISKDYRPLFQYAVDALRGIIQAYNQKAGSNFSAQLTDLPMNLYLGDSLQCDIGTIDFGFDTKWHVYVYANKPPQTDNPPFFQIDVQNLRFKTSDAFRIQIVAPNFRLIGFGGGVAGAARIDAEKPLDSFQAPIRSSLQRLVETQIASLPAK
jgi:hypothetical protein